MGADFNYEIITDPELKMSNKEIETDAEHIFEQAAYNYGHTGYTGTLAEKTDEGVTIHREQVFNDEDTAEEYIKDRLDSDKWGPADVVPIKDTGWFIGGWCSE
ncbi:hypothetical protein LCGC14_3084150 [marine sediment metagenome]|uniref:Uncharacterized protein n=1 Tax=marine sediment metagenome TaxID=412755 RepID=A0A0F8WD67_9ZZZZ